jgi:hypothetical protein
MVNPLVMNPWIWKNSGPLAYPWSQSWASPAEPPVSGGLPESNES